MLVVVSIIGILLAMIIPAISAAREKARDVKCRGNLKELHTAAINFAFVRGDEYLAIKLLPASRSWEEPDEANRWWHWRIGWVDWTERGAVHTMQRGYTRWWGSRAYESITSTNRGEDGKSTTLWEYTGKNIKVYSCPTFARSAIAGTTFPDNPATPLTFDYDKNTGVLRSYAMNSQVSWYNIGSGKAGSRKILFADMSHTNRLGAVQICERGMRDAAAVDVNMRGWNWDGELSGEARSAAFPRECIGTYHSGRGNAVFVDGHIESLLWSDTTNACSGSW